MYGFSLYTNFEAYSTSQYRNIGLDFTKVHLEKKLHICTQVHVPMYESYTLKKRVIERVELLELTHKCKCMIHIILCKL